MDQSEISQEIVNSTHRMLEQIKALEVCPNTPNGVNHRQIDINDNQNQSEVINLISSLQTDQSEELLRDVHNWSDARVHNYQNYEKPLLDQMEINQKTDSTIANECSPRLEVDINNFDNKLTHAKEAVATLAESLIKQRCIDSNESNSNELNNNNDDFSPNILQFQSSTPNEPQMPAYIQPDDYEQLRLREEHLVKIVGELSNEVEMMSNEAVSRNLEILNMQHEAEQKEKELKEVLTNNKEKEELILSFSNRIEELELQLEAEKKKVEEHSLKNNIDENESTNFERYSEASSQTNIEESEEIARKSNNDIENAKKSTSEFRNIDNFSFDIDSDENIAQGENKASANSSIRIIENFSIDIECDQKLLLQNQNETTDNRKQDTEQKEAKKFKKLGEVQNPTNSENENTINNIHFTNPQDLNATPATEFESLLRMENEECPGSAGHTSVLPLGIKPRKISTEKGKRKDIEGWTFRLFFKDRDGGAVIVDADVARRDEKTGVMLLKPTDVRTTSSPNKTNRLAFIEPSTDLDKSEEKTENLDKPSDNQENGKNLPPPNSNAENSTKTSTTNNKNNTTTANKSNTTNPVKNKFTNHDQNFVSKSYPTNSKNQTINNQNRPVATNSKPLTRHQEIMKRILEIHERQLAKIKAARAAAAAYSSSYYYFALKQKESQHETLPQPEANIVNLNKNVERQIKFDRAGLGNWSNFNSRSQKMELPEAVVGSALYPKNNNTNATQNPRILPRKNKKVVVPSQQKMKSPRRPFIL